VLIVFHLLLSLVLVILAVSPSWGTGGRGHSSMVLNMDLHKDTVIYLIILYYSPNGPQEMISDHITCIFLSLKLKKAAKEE